MLKEIRPAIVLIVAAHADHRPRLSARHDRHRPGAVPAPGQRQPDREGRQGGRLGADRPGCSPSDRYFHGRPSATDRPDPNDPPRPSTALQRRQLQRLEPGPDQQGADRARQGRRREAARPRIPARRCRSTWSPRPAAASTRTSRRRPPTSRCRASPRRAACRRIACASWSTSISRAALSASSASRASTCWRSTWRSIAPRRADSGRRRADRRAGSIDGRSAAATSSSGPRRRRCLPRPGARRRAAPAASRSSSAPRPASARPTRCCRRPAPS